MDVECDSFLEQLSDLEIDDQPGIQPYRFEPIRRNDEESSDSSSDTDSSEFSDSDEEIQRHQGHVRAAELLHVSTW